MCTQIMEHIGVNRSVHTACKQHQRVCMQICFCVLCERALSIRTIANKTCGEDTETVAGLKIHVLEAIIQFHFYTKKFESLVNANLTGSGQKQTT